MRIPEELRLSIPQAADKNRRLPQLLSKGDLSRIFRIHKNSIPRWVARGLLPKPIRISGTCVRWRLEDVEKLLSRCEQ
jgi:predicted DNA-binding transcriptional regulator AlpA